jgi:predicted TIM-barrel fold metal-dependent hydrolase
MKPSEYFRRNVTITFEDDLDGILTRDGIGVDSLAWGNDYPHHDSIWPHSRAVLDKTMASCTPEELERICFGNAVALYGIDTTALPAG